MFNQAPNIFFHSGFFFSLSVPLDCNSGKKFLSLYCITLGKCPYMGLNVSIYRQILLLSTPAEINRNSTKNRVLIELVMESIPIIISAVKIYTALMSAPPLPPVCSAYLFVALVLLKTMNKFRL